MYTILILALAALVLAAFLWAARERQRAGAEAWRDMRAGLRWDSHFLERDTVRLLSIHTHNRR